ncbi:MAG: hypothetical protein ACXW4P_22965 [Thermoanaerobaculia bacterium]
MTTLWAAGRKLDLKVAMLFGLPMFVSLVTFFAPTDTNPSCLVVVLIVLMLAGWGYVLVFVPGYVQRCPKALFHVDSNEVPAARLGAGMKWFARHRQRLIDIAISFASSHTLVYGVPGAIDVGP